MYGEDETLERVYLGETAPRRPWVAAALSLLAPGLGWLYVGRVTEALLVNGALLAVVATALSLWNVLHFFPVLPLGLLAIGLVAISVMAACDAARLASLRGERYLLREYNSPIAYAGFFLFGWALPVAALVLWTFMAHWAVVRVTDDAMYPTLLDGDVLLVHRGLETLRRGDVVVVDGTGGEGRRLVRVVGLPGDTVALAEDTVFVNDAPWPRVPLAANALEPVSDRSGALREDLAYFLEGDGERGWASVSPRTVHWASMERHSVGEDEVFVLHDHRGHTDDSRDLGAIAAAGVQGRALYVLRSAGMDPATAEAGAIGRPERVGRRIQAAPLGR